MKIWTVVLATLYTLLFLAGCYFLYLGFQPAHPLDPEQGAWQKALATFMGLCLIAPALIIVLVWGAWFITRGSFRKLEQMFFR